MPRSKVRPEPRIPDHEVLRQIGGGAYGEVWLARGVTGAMRAVKVVYWDDFENEREFEREFQGILKYEPISRDHPALVHILHVGRSPEQQQFYYYVMELGDDVRTGREINAVEYEPRTLRTDMKVADGMPLDTDLCIRVGRSLSQGLAHLHGNGLAHRDVKPANVIFVDGKAKLADIGLVALRGQRTFVGTEGFVPPEGPGSAQADVYSLGKVLYEMATGMDRLEFPELPDELPEGIDLKRWRAVNGIICDICEPRITHRRINTAEQAAEEFALLEEGRKRKVEVSPVWTLLVLCLALLVGGGWNFGVLGSWVVRSGEDQTAPFVPPPTEFGKVTVISDPLGADVYSEEGELLGQAPVRLDMPVGMWVNFEFRLRGFQTATAGGLVRKEGLVIEPSLKIYAPPQRGENWEDVVGMTYRWEVDSHVSHYYVGEHEWNLYREDTKAKPARVVELTENGRKRNVVLADQGEARNYVKWLTQQCRDGYLNSDQIIQPRLDRQRDLSAQFPEGPPKGQFPFRCVVLQGARVMVTSEPAGAEVSINGEYRGETPLTAENGQLGVPVAPGSILITVKADGFKTIEKPFSLDPNEVWEVPEHFVLEPSMGAVFGRPWENSLGMKFAPIGQDLLAAVWETRTADFARFMDSGQTVVYPLEVPTFEQGPNHPVVHVSREDAVAFCEWLTAEERKSEFISKTHEYRLPTDLEWSRLAGLEGEIGDSPQERDGQIGGYPWGAVWPPPAMAGNFADEAADDLPVQFIIQGYLDGFSRTAPVGSFPANEADLFDVSGNVYEWVGDNYNQGQGVYGVLRGGGWADYRKQLLRTSARLPKRPSDHNEWTGFRVVLAKIPPKKENVGGEILEGEEPESETETP